MRAILGDDPSTRARLWPKLFPASRQARSKSHSTLLVSPRIWRPCSRRTDTTSSVSEAELLTNAGRQRRPRIRRRCRGGSPPDAGLQSCAQPVRGGGQPLW